MATLYWPLLYWHEVPGACQKYPARDRRCASCVLD